MLILQYLKEKEINFIIERVKLDIELFEKLMLIADTTKERMTYEKSLNKYKKLYDEIYDYIHN